MPLDIADGVSKSSTGESGGLFVRGVDRQRFLDYICSNWREISDDIESLPKADGDFVGDNSAYDCSVETFGAACEALSPSEYLDFMDRFIELREQGRIGQRPFEAQLAGSSKKQDFLAVNWQHPRVQTILANARKQIGKDDIHMLDWIDRISSGELADNYMTNRSNGAPFPETLPGIKLERPWGKMIQKYERLTGKKVPDDELEERWKEHDSKWRARYERRKRGEAEGPEPDPPRTYEPRYSLLFAIFMILIGFMAWIVLRLKRAHRNHPG